LFFVAFQHSIVLESDEVEELSMASNHTQSLFGHQPDASPSVDAKNPSPTRPWIERQFALFHTIIPAYSGNIGQRRTSYFYRKQAIAWAGMARQHWPTPDFPALCARLAKSYLATYRKLKGLS
jgi:hypothetical protein